jgi:transcriptional regulator with XRE-family HTH domain
MRWRGIRSQRQLARLSGVPQTSIHRILSRSDSYMPALGTLSRLARALDSTVPWLSEGMESMRQATTLCEPSARMSYQACGDAAELHMLMVELSPAERRAIVTLVRLMANRPTWDAQDAHRSSLSDPAPGRPEG